MKGEAPPHLSTAGEGTHIRDPITLEVFKNAVTGAADEMGLTMLQTSHSPLLREALDFSTGICAANGDVLAQGNAILLHLGTMSDAVRQVLKKFAGRIDPGDLFIFNDEEEVAQHLPDIYAVKPVFAEGTLIGFVVCMAHHVDIGGRVAGGIAIDSTEIYQEGLQIPLLKLYEAGRRNDSYLELHLRNVRLPDLVAGDWEGQIAACHVGEARLIALAQKHGVAQFRCLGRELIDYSERLTRIEIAALPDGVYKFEDWLDDDGIGEGEPLPIRVAVDIAGDKIRVDWSGSTAQVKYAINVHMSNTRSVTYGGLLGVFTGEIPPNEGFYKPISVTAPVGSIMNPMRPAARAQRGLTASRMMDCLFGALAKAVPKRAMAADGGGVVGYQIAGLDRNGRFLLSHGGYLWSSWGGRWGADGIDGISPYYTNLSSLPIEEIEREGSIRILRHTFIPDTGGPGQWRGGLGLIRDMRFLGREGTLHLRGSRYVTSPFGLFGGHPGTRCRFIRNPDTPEEEVLRTSGPVPVDEGDVIRTITPSGGGYGDPLQRHPSAVLDDIIDGKVTASLAEEAYGVVLEEGSSAVDEERTSRLRAARRRRG